MAGLIGNLDWQRHSAQMIRRCNHVSERPAKGGRAFASNFGIVSHGLDFGLPRRLREDLLPPAINLKGQSDLKC
jgi:hypothetical protein